MQKKLVLLHGALGAGEQLQALAQNLADTYEVKVYEFSGHGKQADDVAPFTIEKLAVDFHHWLQQEYTQPVNVFGYSMGGYVSLSLATTYPQLFEKIVTLGTKFKWSKEESVKETAKLNPQFLLEKAPAYCDYLVQLHGTNHWKNVLKKTAGLMVELGEKPLLNEVTLSMIQTPVQLMLGELDKMVTREETEMVQHQLKHATFEIIPGFVHPLERLDAQQLAEILRTKY